MAFLMDDLDRPASCINKKTIDSDNIKKIAKARLLQEMKNSNKYFEQVIFIMVYENMHHYNTGYYPADCVTRCSRGKL